MTVEEGNNRGQVADEVKVPFWTILARGEDEFMRRLFGAVTLPKSDNSDIGAAADDDDGESSSSFMAKTHMDALMQSHRRKSNWKVRDILMMMIERKHV